MSASPIVVIGSGIGGLVAGALLARYGRPVLVCESHGVAGGAAHGFVRGGFRFDSGPSFYCGLSDPQSLNPLRQVLDVLDESVDAIAYDPLGHYHFPEGTLPIYGNLERYREAIAQFSSTGAAEFRQLETKLLGLYQGLREIPTLALRSDVRLLAVLLGRYGWPFLKLLPKIKTLQASVGDLVAETVQDPFVRQLIDLECFLLSGLKAQGTVAPEVAFMFGERTHSVIDYPVNGSGAIVDALGRGLRKYGGELRLNAHVEKILVTDGQITGIRLRTGEVIETTTVISNATLWDTINHLLDPQDLPQAYRQQSLQTQAINSFMHLHLGIRADGLDDLTTHHVVVHRRDRDLTAPGNTCMISIPSVLAPNLAPTGHHVIHAYTLEPWGPWQQDQAAYAERKQVRAEPLFQAVEKIIPDLRDRLVVNLIGTPLTHQRYLRRHQGTYGPAIAAGQGRFPSCHTPIQGLYRVGDSTLPGIGVPAVAASGILCANTLVSPAQTAVLLDKLMS